ncbi:MAG: DeoR/GlpR family DNA-binding transcription regulator [Clostridia bacterium]|nr:DeoR/GlpR family DNA-binding transcription regulator [Clostridia bacterium]
MTGERAEDLSVEDRRRKILEMINSNGKVKVTELSRLFGISEVTIRNDLTELENQGLLERIHGGAVSTYKNYYSMTFSDRLNTNTDEKRKIAVAAANLISDGDTVLLGSGTTPLFVAKALKGKKSLTIVTNSLSIAQEASFDLNFYVIMLGGNLISQYLFTYGDDTISQLKRYKADKLIISPDGVSAEDGVSTCYHHEAEICRQMISRSNECIVIADYTKIGRASFVHIESIDRVDRLITNDIANKDEIAAIRKMGVEVNLV